MSSGPKIGVVYLAASNFSAIDAFLPVVAELGMAETDKPSIDTVMLFDRGHRYLTQSRMHYDVVKANSNYFRPVPSFPIPALKGALRLLAFTSLLIRRRVEGRRLVILCPWLAKSQVERIIQGIARLLGDFYRFPVLQTPRTAEYVARFAIWNKLQEMGIKSGDGSVQMKALERSICYLESEREQYLDGAQATLVPIGVPRLYPGWKTAVERHAPVAVAAALVEVGLPQDTPRFGVVILTTPDYFWFNDPATDYVRMLREIIVSHRRHFPGLPILLKPKPAHRPRFEALLTEHAILADDVKLVNAALSALATRAAWALTINESSGVFDFVTLGVPTLEYASYSKKWLDIYPAGSAWRVLPGLRFLETPEELDATLKAVAVGAFAASNVKSLVEYFGHRRDLRFFGIPVGKAM
jgi:hypothetical protein